jgi:hypothetical protein
MAISTALFLSSAVRFELFRGSPRAELDYGLIAALATPMWLILFWAYRLYEPRQVLSPVNELTHVFHGVMGGIVAIFVADSLFELELARGVGPDCNGDLPRRRLLRAAFGSQDVALCSTARRESDAHDRSGDKS